MSKEEKEAEEVKKKETKEEYTRRDMRQETR